jgi:hypothetical protein
VGRWPATTDEERHITMKATVTAETERAITDIAGRYGLSQEAVLAMLLAVHAGGGTMAQFNIPELGGSGQWMRGGMTMVGNMFDNTLKARVDALCGELAQLVSTTSVFPASQQQSQGGLTSSNWWPADLGVPSSVGGQNDARYAVFPGTRRLATQINGRTRVYDTGDHRIGGVQQQQGGRHGSVTFTSQLGTFDVSSLHELGARQVADTPAGAPTPTRPPSPQPAASSPVPPAEPPSESAAIIAAIESLAGLHQRGILSDEEFAAKKAELLGRL